MTVTAEILPRTQGAAGVGGPETGEPAGRLGSPWASSTRSSTPARAASSSRWSRSPRSSARSSPRWKRAPTTSCAPSPPTWREQLDQVDDDDKQQEHLDDLLPEAFAAVREAGKRTLGQRHFDVQLMGGAALHFGWVAEMKTGEGKTLVATLPVVPQRARRRAACTSSRSTTTSPSATPSGWARSTGSSGSRSASCIPEIDDSDAKRRAYAADITYGTNNEFGFDYLRDNMAVAREDQVQRGHTFAIVDEVDSILIDEARTPLIISGPRRRRAGALRASSPAIVKAAQARPRLRGRRGEAHRRAHRGGHRPRSSRRSASRTSTSTSTRTSCTSSRPRCGPRSSSSATSTTSCRTAR